LVELREQGSVRAVGVGSKDWNIIQRLVHDGVSLDWVMLANSFTLYTHHHFWHLETVLEAFGPSRLMFGSDKPVCLLATGYADWLALIRRFIAPLSAHEQSEILAGSARRAYGLSDPKK
jgi:hypothetical protein